MQQKLQFTPLLFSLLCFTSVNTTAQEWFPLGAYWHYNQIILLQGETYSYFEVVEELEINGREVKVISGTCNCGTEGGYFYQEGDKIYLFNPGSLDSLTILYDFTLVAGDTLTFKGDSLFGGDGKFLIDSITEMQFGSEILRVQHITTLNPLIGWGNKIIERIGANGCMYRQYAFCDPSTGGLRCYEDDEIGLINFQIPLRPCTYVTGTNNQTVEPVIIIFPNPASSSVYIQSAKPIERIILFNNLSIPIYHFASIVSTDFEFDVVHLPHGIYHIQAVLSNHQIVHRSIIIQK